jgi:hypothetical protein
LQLLVATRQSLAALQRSALAVVQRCPVVQLQPSMLTAATLSFPAVLEQSVGMWS